MTIEAQHAWLLAHGYTAEEATEQTGYDPSHQPADITPPSPIGRSNDPEFMWSIWQESDCELQLLDLADDGMSPEDIAAIRSSWEFEPYDPDPLVIEHFRSMHQLYGDELEERERLAQQSSSQQPAA